MVLVPLILPYDFLVLTAETYKVWFWSDLLQHKVHYSLHEIRFIWVQKLKGVTYRQAQVCRNHGDYDMIYLLTAIRLTPGGSSTVHINTQTTHITTQNKQYIQHKI
jgi:hypothetical protein